MANTRIVTPVKTSFSVEGRFIDIAHYQRGRSEVIREGHNIVTDAGLGMVTGALAGWNGGIAFWRIGTGDPAWDTSPVEPGPDATALFAPILTKPVTISFWDRANNRFSQTPTDTLDVRILLLAEEANAPLREFGLLGAAPELILFNYVIHERIEKSVNFNLERILRITIRRI